MANTRETMGEQACLDALVANTLTSFEDDGVTKVGASCLQYHTALTDVTLSQCKSVESYGLGDCTNLEVVDILGTGKINTSAFNGSNKLQHIILRGSSVTSTSQSALAGTPFIYAEGAIYVPQDLVDSYKADSFWSNYIVLPISSYPASAFETVSDSWSDIATASSNGTYASKYAVGDVKSMVIDGKTYYFQLVAKDADVLSSDGTTTVPMTWLMHKKFLTTIHRMSPSDSSGTQGTGGNGGWEYSELRSYLNDTILPLMPSDVRDAIKTVKKYSSNVVPGTQTAVKDGCITADKLWVPSYREAYGGNDLETNGPSYSGVLSSNDKRIKFNSQNTSYTWWTRSAVSNTSYQTVRTTGATSTGATATSYGVVIGFCI